MNANIEDLQDANTTHDFERHVAQEMLIESATEKILELMEREGVSRAELARRVGKSRPFITQVMDGSRNMTLRTVADLAFALGYELRLDEADTSAAMCPPRYGRTLAAPKEGGGAHRLAMTGVALRPGAWGATDLQCGYRESRVLQGATASERPLADAV